MFETLAQFYNSNEWRRFRQQLIAERTNKTDGILYCEFSGKPILHGYDCVAHHIQPITPQNVNDFTISLNTSNIMLVSQQSHNELHQRFGYGSGRKVYIVYGAPCSGKTTFVNNSHGNSDIIVDIDSIWQCITGGNRYSKPNALKSNAFAVRNTLLDNIKRRYGNWERAWIIEGLPFRSVRDEMARTYGAELIHIDADRELCLQRLHNDETRCKVIKEWQRYIDDYFAAYQE